MDLALEGQRSLPGRLPILTRRCAQRCSFVGPGHGAQLLDEQCVASDQRQARRAERGPSRCGRLSLLWRAQVTPAELHARGLMETGPEVVPPFAYASPSFEKCYCESESALMQVHCQH